MLFIISVLGYLGYFNVKELGGQIQEVGKAADIILDEQVPLADAAMESTIALITGRDLMGEYLLETDLNELSGLEKEFHGTTRDFEEEIRPLIKCDDTQVVLLAKKAKALNETFKQASISMMQAHRESLKLKEVELSEADLKGRKYMEELDGASLEQEKLLEEAEVIVMKAMAGAMARADKIQEEAGRAAATSKTLLLITLFAGILLGIATSFFISRGINGILRSVAEQLTEGADQVASGSGQVSSASQSLAEGSAEQAASLEETSSSLEEMASMTRQNADNANQADNLMKEANQVVGKANESMTELTTSMEEISKASEETSKIIKTIDEIAFQTNLLALNAAVEAARAGEAGAGFAVVADEVRNLAMRAAEAAKTTAGLIEGTVKKVKDGAELVTRTNEAFVEVAKSAGKVGELVGEISAASTEQAQGIDEVSKAMAEVDKVTQQSASSAEQSASASEEMNAQAEQMKVIVDKLLDLVGGRKNEVSRRYGAAAGVEHVGTMIGGGVRKALKAPARTTEEVAVPKAQPEPRRGREVKPEEVIPMEEEEFKDF